MPKARTLAFVVSLCLLAASCGENSQKHKPTTIPPSEPSNNAGDATQPDNVVRDVQPKETVGREAMRQEADKVAAVAAYNIGTIDMQKKKYLIAVAMFDKAIKLDPDFAQAHNNRAIAYTKMGMYDKALAGFKRALEIDPTLADALKNLKDLQIGTKRESEGLSRQGLSDLTRGEPGDAIASCSEAIQLNSENVFAWRIRGRAHLEQKEYDEAIRNFTEAIRLDPKGDAGTYLNRSLAYMRAMQTDKAREDHNMAVRLNPVLRNRYPDLESLNKLAPIGKRRPDDKLGRQAESLPSELVNILRGYSEPSSEREAYRQARKFLEDNEESALGHYLYAYGCAMAGKTDDAVQHFKRSLECGLPQRQKDIATRVVNATTAKPGETTPTFVRVSKAFGEVQLDVLRLADGLSGSRSKEKQVLLKKVPEIQDFVTALKFGGPMRVVHEALAGTQHSVSWADGQIGKVPRERVYKELQNVRVKDWEVFPGTATSQELYEWLEPTATEVYRLSLNVFRDLSVPRMHKWVVDDDPPDALLLVWTEQEVGGSPIRIGGEPMPREVLRKPMLFRWDKGKVNASADAPIPERIEKLERDADGK